LIGDSQHLEVKPLGPLIDHRRFEIRQDQVLAAITAIGYDYLFHAADLEQQSA